LIWRYRFAASSLRDGGIVAYPTEAVFGLGCDPLNREAVMRLLQIKRRSVVKGLILIGAEFEQLQPFVANLTRKTKKKITATWPGPITWILPASESVPGWITGNHKSVAVRVTAHPVAAELCRAWGGALVSTSANISARPPARSALAVRKSFGEAVDVVLHGETGKRSRPTEIRDAISNRQVRL